MILTAPDKYRRRYSLCHTIWVAPRYAKAPTKGEASQPTHWEVFDLLTAERHRLPTLRDAVGHASKLQWARPRLAWVPWERLVGPNGVHVGWRRETADGLVLVQVNLAPMPGGDHQIEISHGDRSSRMAWRARGSRSISSVRAEALAWGAHEYLRRGLGAAQ